MTTLTQLFSLLPTEILIFALVVICLYLLAVIYQLLHPVIELTTDGQSDDVYFVPVPDAKKWHKNNRS